MVDLIGREGRRRWVARDGDVVDLSDVGVEFGDIKGDGYLEGDGEAADGGDEDHGGAEGEFDSEVQVFGLGGERGWG